MSSTTNTEPAPTVDLQAVAMVAMFRSAAETKKEELRASQLALEENRSRLDLLCEQIKSQPLTLIANRWGSYVSSSQLIQRDRDDHSSHRYVARLYHPWSAGFFDHAPKDEWSELFNSLAPAPLLTVKALVNGYAVTNPKWAKPRVLTDIGEVLEQIIETLTENGVTVKEDTKEDTE